jgi:alanine racemase
VRPGIGLYGGGPFARSHPQLRPVATLAAPILQVRAVAAGETIGYGATFTAERAYRVAVLAAGYADGVLRSSAGRGRAWFAGDFRRILGRISMDLMVVDVTGCEAAGPGAMVELLGPHVTVDEAAEAAGTAAYEVLTRLGPRAERVYSGAQG